MMNFNISSLSVLYCIILCRIVGATNKNVDSSSAAAQQSKAQVKKERDAAAVKPTNTSDPNPILKEHNFANLDNFEFNADVANGVCMDVDNNF